MDLDFSSDNPKMMTYHSSKGLQFEHVFIPECTVEDDDNRNTLYVAVTRTYRALYIMHSGNLSSLFDDPVFANDKEQVILLYSKYPRFKVEENDLENYPMVIEIESEDYKEGFFEKAK